MNNNINPNSEESPQEIKAKEAKQRSEAYPVKTFNEIFSFVEKVYSTYGGTSYHTNIEVAGAVGLATATIKQPLSTAQQYGLLENKHGKGYRVTPLFQNIVLWENENDKLANIIESLRSPAIFKKFFEDYTGQVVPTIVGLKNRIQREYSLKENLAELVANIFLENLKSFNLLNSKNVLINSPAFALQRKAQIEEEEKDTTEKPATDISAAVSEPFQQKQPNTSDFIEIPIPLKSVALNATLILPRNYTTEDLQRISKFVTALE